MTARLVEHLSIAGCVAVAIVLVLIAFPPLREAGRETGSAAGAVTSFHPAARPALPFPPD